ncbi:hypothetical protein ABZ671_20585 [Micromonospora sp. NPDC006766]|uniref:hypothetical protein n=1 Tax=Micromonospora sp. NPDC006766 TaxID=3154778 RepID=UPI0034113313
MPEPQPGTDRPADGSTLGAGPEPGTDGSARSPVPPPAGSAGPPDAASEPVASRWSGSAPVPPPPPRKRSWGESAEPTPPPLEESPEHMVPVDPWEGVDTAGWDLRSADFPALPPTPPYPAPAHTLPYPPPSAAATPVPPTPGRPPEQRRRTTPTAPTPPGWRPPQGYAAVPARRRRRWPWMMVLIVACCCGVPLWWAQPLRAQYPASAALPDQFAGLRLRQDERSQSAAEQLRNEVRQAYPRADDTFAGIYTTGEGKRVTLFGGTGLRLTPQADADAEIVRGRDRYALGPAETVETGVRGRYERCAVGRADGDAVVLCTSVDHGSLVTGLFTWLDVNDSGHLLDQLRQQVVTVRQS